MYKIITMQSSNINKNSVYNNLLVFEERNLDCIAHIKRF